MIPSTFTYKRAGSAEEALDLAAEHGEDAKFLAGGHSLLPLMKLRLAAPEVIIDLGGLRDLSYITDQGSHVAIGALTRHHDVEHSELLGSAVPLLAYAAGQVGDPQVRHRGTIGGSIAHADPASDLPAVLLALDATLVARGPGGDREIPIGEFFQGLFETALEPGELLTEIRVPKPASPGAWSFQKFTQRAMDWAIVGCAVQDGKVGLVNMGGTPLRATAVEAALADGAAPADAAERAAEGTTAADDIRATRAYREHLARVLVSRALTEAHSRSLSGTARGASLTSGCPLAPRIVRGWSRPTRWHMSDARPSATARTLIHPPAPPPSRRAPTQPPGRSSSRPRANAPKPHRPH